MGFYSYPCKTVFNRWFVAAFHGGKEGVLFNRVSPLVWSFLCMPLGGGCVSFRVVCHLEAVCRLGGAFA